MATKKTKAPARAPKKKTKAAKAPKKKAKALKPAKTVKAVKAAKTKKANASAKAPNKTGNKKSGHCREGMVFFVAHERTRKFEKESIKCLIAYSTNIPGEQQATENGVDR